MNSYIVIDGKKVVLPDELVERIKEVVKREEDDELLQFVEDASALFNPTNISFARGNVHIGISFCPEHLKGRCLVLSNLYDWEILPNPTEKIFTKLLIAKKKK